MRKEEEGGAQRKIRRKLAENIIFRKKYLQNQISCKFQVTRLSQAENYLFGIFFKLILTS